MKIVRFEGAFSFLSNFFCPCKVEYEGITYPSSEHAYQASKTLHLDTKLRIAHAGDMQSPFAVKKFGGSLEMKAEQRADWHQVSLRIMEEIVYAKFSQNADMKERLLATKDMELIEGNHWHDTFWGVCDGVGENHLGKILMKVREQLR
jgi:N-glycosidase YbiA